MSVITITSEIFEEEVIHAKETVLVDFWASWCGPCKMLSPIVDEIAEELNGKVKVGKVNVDEQIELASKYKVMSIPTLIVFQNGERTGISIGVKSKQEILAMIQ